MKIPTNRELLSKKYREALNLFLSNDELRPALSKPFIQEEFVFASDGSIILQFEKSKLLEIDFTSHEKAPNALAIIPTEDNMTVVFETKLLRDKIAESRETVSKRYTKASIDCPDCLGTGMVDYNFEDYLGETHSVSQDCPSCGQDMKIQIIKDVETGKDVEIILEYLAWHDTFFTTDYIEKIVQVAEMFDEKLIKLVHRKSTTSLHKFTVGECSICLMPVNSTGDQSIVTLIS